ncbi:uncharacterized protein BT62DRAFT_1014080 [Guyanagaster necrorhizus]|uniref:Uncharacterized protein n=1 Tax=Guyanagaster necrorhizus TaxID=856835 RepID=A0A9P8AL77_9AGAR|nr:uncharacterized protein BT62DRAFT_1014080 [Guyanagaster necrorhizus MCA 3950]KAG7439341.1 hypothetical protein BT62DRAFT_1014080 [Guyanagaster necrorhizus MCA 3950]
MFGADPTDSRYISTFTASYGDDILLQQYSLLRTHMFSSIFMHYIDNDIKDICTKRQVDAIHPYSPSVDATELVRYGFLSFDVCQVSIANDIAHVEKELQKIEPLFQKILDRHKKLFKDLGGCRLAPIQRLPRESLPTIFGLLPNVHLSTIWHHEWFTHLFNDFHLSLLGKIRVRSSRSQ